MNYHAEFILNNSIFSTNRIDTLPFRYVAPVAWEAFYDAINVRLSDIRSYSPTPEYRIIIMVISSDWGAPSANFRMESMIC